MADAFGNPLAVPAAVGPDDQMEGTAESFPDVESGVDVEDHI